MAETTTLIEGESRCERVQSLFVYHYGWNVTAQPSGWCMQGKRRCSMCLSPCPMIWTQLPLALDPQ